MIEICNYDDCTGCSACLSVCPVSCIEMVDDSEGFKRPIIDNNRCIDCGLCKKTCTVHSCSKNRILDTFVGYNKDATVLRNSSSGGAFTAISKIWASLYKDNYKIYGAAFTDEFVVRHKAIDNINRISEFQGSKYVQSDLTNSFHLIKSDLDDGIFVLFSGTPCQVAGLRNYLKVEYDNLLCVDVVCHGVPSPKVFANYVSFLERTHKSKINRISFTDKLYGWINRYIVIKFSNGKSHKRLSITFDDPYMSSFFNHYVLRPSCYICQFTDIRRVADITMADSWGVDKLNPEINYKHGSSLIIISTKKGKDISKYFNQYLNLSNVDLNPYVKYNPQLHHPVSVPTNREEMIKLAVSENNFTNYFQNIIFTRPRLKQFLSQMKYYIKNL